MREFRLQTFNSANLELTHQRDHDLWQQPLAHKIHFEISKVNTTDTRLTMTVADHRVGFHEIVEESPNLLCIRVHTPIKIFAKADP